MRRSLRRKNFCGLHVCGYDSRDADDLAGEDLAEIDLRRLKQMPPQVVIVTALSWKGWSRSGRSRYGRGEGRYRCAGYCIYRVAFLTLFRLRSSNGLLLIDALCTSLSAQHPPMGSRPEQSRLQSEARHIQILVFVADA